MVEIRKIYRAQYMQTLQRVTREEAAREAALYLEETAERNRVKNEKLKLRALDLKRRAIFADRKKIDARVNEAVEVARRAKTKARRMSVLKTIDGSINFQVPEENEKTGETAPVTDIFPRDISATDLMQKLGNAKNPMMIKSRKIHRTKNIFREVLERSYEILPEDDDVSESPFGFSSLLPTPETGLTPEQVADLYYVGFSPEEKLELVEKKICMLEKRMQAEELKGDSTDPLTQQLIDILTAAKAARLEEAQVAICKANDLKE